MKDFRSMLNSAQLQATTYQGGPLLVLAGPGTGKTRVLVSRIVHYIEERAIRPENILAITFTNQAAGEIKERIRASLSRNHAPSHVNTFHGWAYSFLKEHLGGEARSVIDEKDAIHILKNTLQNIGAHGHKPRADLLKGLLHHLPEEMDEVELNIYTSYKNTIHGYGLWDFDDLILESIRLLRDSSAREALHKKLSFILIDEFQDFNSPQYELVKLLSTKDGEITVIGDPHQSIYGFRGASPGFIQKFIEDFPQVRTIFLDTVYRCPQTFLDAAQSALTAFEPQEKRLISQKGEGPLIKYMEFPDSSKEASWIAETIERIVGGLNFDSIHAGKARGSDFRSLSDVAVLFRLNVVGDEIAKALDRHGLPYQRADRVDPLDDKGLKALWRSFEIIHERGTKYHLQRLSEELAMDEETIMDGMDALQGLDPLTYIERFMEVFSVDIPTHTLNAFCRGGFETRPYNNDSRMQGFKASSMNSISLILQKGIDLLDVDVEGVRLLSIHASKGLEFPVVILSGCEDGILPLKNTQNDEERRLFYVALTRASEELYLLGSRKRRLWGRWQEFEKSPFLHNILPERMERINYKEKRKAKKRKPLQKKLF